MEELTSFGTIVLVVSGGLLLALVATKLSERVPVPEPALFLILAAVASDAFPALSDRLSIQDVERIAVVALIVILFNGGTLVGWRRFRAGRALAIRGVPPRSGRRPGDQSAVLARFLGFVSSRRWQLDPGAGATFTLTLPPAG